MRKDLNRVITLALIVITLGVHTFVILSHHQKLSYTDLKNRTVYLRNYLDTELLQEGTGGTGIVYKITDKATYILTCYHVLNACSEDKLYVRTIKGKLPTTIIKINEEEDLALIKVNERLNKKAIKGVVKQYKLGGFVNSTGHYLGKPYFYNEGVITAKSGRYLVCQLPTASGDSGSGVFNRKGELVGLVRGIKILPNIQLDTTQAMCIPAETIKEFLGDF